MSCYARKQEKRAKRLWLSVTRVGLTHATISTEHKKSGERGNVAEKTMPEVPCWKRVAEGLGAAGYGPLEKGQGESEHTLEKKQLERPTTASLVEKERKLVQKKKGET